jgi:hypothetical protein
MDGADGAQMPEFQIHPVVNLMFIMRIMKLSHITGFATRA